MSEIQFILIAIDDFLILAYNKEEVTMKIKCPICGEITELENKECQFCKTSTPDIRKTLFRQREQALLKENAVLTSKELEEIFEFEESGTGYALKEYFGVENVVFLPSKYKGKAVNAISPHAFEASDVEEVHIPDSVRVIMRHSFEDCFRLKKVVISSRLKTIEENAFSNCVALKTIVLPDSVTEIGKYAFSGCINLKKVNLPEKIEVIEEGTFENCSSLPHFVMPQKLKIISSNAFSGCAGITKIKFNEGLLSIGEGAFSGCASLERVLLSESVTTLGDYSFQDCKQLRAFYVGKSLANFSGLSFYGSDNLSMFKVSELNGAYKVSGNGIIENKSESLILGSALTVLDEMTKGILPYAYSGKSFRNEIFVPKTVISVGANAFYETANFEIKIEHKEKPKKWSENWLLGENKVCWGERKAD